MSSGLLGRFLGGARDCLLNRLQIPKSAQRSQKKPVCIDERILQTYQRLPESVH